MEKKVPSVPMRFVLPVIIESLVTIITTLVFSQIVSTVSESALAATGLADTVMALLIGVCALVSTGSAVVVSQQIGAHAYTEAARTVERTTGLTILITGALVILMEVLAHPFMKLLMVNAEDTFFNESLRYFRLMVLSIPLQVLTAAFIGISRGMGDSRSPMIAMGVRNLSQLLLAWLLIHGLHLEEVGAGWAHILSRTIGLLLSFFAIKYNPRHILIRFKNSFRFRSNPGLTRSILRIGAPSSLSGTAVQFGYMLVNSIAASLGTFDCGVYQLLTTVNSFIGFPQTITTSVALPMIGNLLGAKEVKKAKKTGFWIFLIGIAATVLLAAAVIFSGKQILGLYSANGEMVGQANSMLWILLILNISAMGINSLAPQLQAGGDTKTTMLFDMVTVWVIRVPLSYLFCFRLQWGVAGLFWANIINLYVRWAMVMIRWLGKRWYANKI